MKSKYNNKQQKYLLISALLIVEDEEQRICVTNKKRMKIDEYILTTIIANNNNIYLCRISQTQPRYQTPDAAPDFFYKKKQTIFSIWLTTIERNSPVDNAQAQRSVLVAVNIINQKIMILKQQQK